MRKVILRNNLAPGDAVMLTAAVRDLHRCHPGVFFTDVRTPYPNLWENNPYITDLDEADPEVEILDCHYPLIHKSNQVPRHFLEGFIEYLNEQLETSVRLTSFRGDIHLTDDEQARASPVTELTGWDGAYWIVSAGGKRDFTIKWWHEDRYQEVIDHFKGRIRFVQVGSAGHYHPELEGAIDLRGRTKLRELIRMVHHAEGVLTPISLLMHLAAAVDRSRPKRV